MSVDVDEAAAPVVEPGEKPRESRSYTFEYEIRSEDSDGLNIEGYAAVFDQPATVRDWRGVYTETIERGAFTKTLREQRTPDLLFEHGRHPLIGRLPPGVLHRIGEDARGLHIRGRMFNNWLMAPIVDAVRAGAIDGMSFEMHVSPERETWSSDRSRRTIREVALVPEVTITGSPVYEGTSFTLRSFQALRDLDDPEIRAWLDAARLGTSAGIAGSDAAPAGTSGRATEPHPEHSVIPPETLALWRRHMTRRHAQ